MLLIRDVNIKKGKNQEERFSNTENFSFFFDTEKELIGVDQWSYANTIKIAKNAPKDIIVLFSKWTKNIEYIYQNKNIKIKNQKFILSEDFKKYYVAKDVLRLREIIINSNENKITSFLLFVLNDLPKENLIKNLKLINIALNSNMVSQKQILNIFLLNIFEGNNE